jgi:hypothetical protein
MWLVSDLTPADIDDPQPGAVFAGRIGLDRAQVVERLPSLRLAAGRIMELAHDAKRSRLGRANLWRASSASSACFGAVLFGMGLSGKRRNAVSCSHAAIRSAAGQTC